MDTVATAEIPKPIVHEASRAMDVMTPPKMVPRVAPEPFDPLRSFEREGDQKKADLQTWHTRPDPATRASMVALFEEQYLLDYTLAHKAKDEDKKRRIKEDRWRCYSWIIWREGHPVTDKQGRVLPWGSKDIALKVAELLFAPLQPVATDKKTK